MVQIDIKNTEVSDVGYGVYVDGKRLEDIISLALGTVVGKTREKSGKKFKSNCCNVTVIIDPMPDPTIKIEDAEYIYHDLESLEEDGYEQYIKNNKETATEK